MHYLLLGIWLTGVALGQPQGSGQGVRWKLHDDPSGFTLQVPESWTLAVNRGSITMQGPDSVRASIWPTVIRNQKLDDAAAQILLQRVASQSEPEFRWSPIRQNGKFIAVSGRSGSSSATMSLTWASADYGTSAIIYFASASASRYDSMRPIFAKVFGSFDPKTEASGKSPSSVSALGQLQYVPWTDPLEQAFTIDVPKGWKIIGGQHSLTANDTRGAAVMIAEGGGAVVQFGQSEFGSFIEPVRTPYGSIQSGYYPLGDGTQLLVSPYMSGDQFARFYLQRTPPKCSDVRVTTARPRPDLTARLLQVVQKSGIQLGSQAQMSEILFTCSSSNQILNGSYVAATTVVPTATSRSGMGGAIWSVVYFGGYLGTPELAADAAKISDNALASLTINPQWLQQRNAVAQRAVIEDKIRSQQFQAQVLAQIAKTQQDISNTITQGYWQRSKVYDEISRKRENAILGTVDVVNPASGDRFKLENSSNYYWMNDQGYKAGTLTHTAPGTGWQELLALP